MTDVNKQLDFLSASINIPTSSGQPEALQQLQEAFQVFTEASSRFEEHYARLESRIAELNLELESANAKLRRNLDEKQKMQDYLSTILESLPMGVLGLDEAGVIQSCNQSAAHILEISPGELDGSNILEALVWDGQTVLDENGVTMYLDSENDTGLSGSALKPGGRVEIAYQPHSDFSRKVLRLQLVSNLASDLALSHMEADQTVRVMLIEDVTQMRRLEQQASRKSRLAAMGEIAMNVAHEIRNPLGSIELFASMLQRDLADDPKNGSLAGHICTGVRCVDHIVANILQFARPQRLICSSFDLVALVDETLVYAEHALRQKNIGTIRDYPESECLIHADAELLKQMFLNLFLNAIHATPQDGSVGVAVRETKGSAEVRIWDSGKGLPPDIIGKIFDPFFTTRRKGTGLGLTIVHNIVSVHQGGIDAANRDEGGAIFTITLPLGALRAKNNNEFDLLMYDKEENDVNAHIGS
ncbi:MAG: sensor histidine kinase [Candidatus Sumerlaeia bacterium]